MNIERKPQILWADDEIDLLEPHIRFLDQKGYHVVPVHSGEAALEEIRKKDFDLVLLDEMMDGIDGLETLEEIKKIYPGMPIVMVTKNEEESLMEDAIGGQIRDYLTKPVNPSQILMACKKIIDHSNIVKNKIRSRYLEGFNHLSMRLIEPLSLDEWIEIHNQLSQWQIELDKHSDLGFGEMLADQRETANREFSRVVENEYHNWLDGDSIILSPRVASNAIKPILQDGGKVLFVVVDCMRLDQWLTLEPLFYEDYLLKKSTHVSILPTATPYSRNAIFSGLFPAEISQQYPQYHQADSGNEGGLNQFENELLDLQVKKWDLDVKPKYFKPLQLAEGEKLLNNFGSIQHENLISVVVNFVDFVAHTRSESKIVQEMVPDESAYRSMIRTWFEGSWIFKLIQKSTQSGFTVVITSDHGSIRVQRGEKVMGDRETSAGIRYKHGRNISSAGKNTMRIKDPAQYKLPSKSMNENFLLAKSDAFFLYPNNFHKYERMLKNTFQHGGISLDEMILPIAILTGKS